MAKYKYGTYNHQINSFEFQRKKKRAVEVTIHNSVRRSALFFSMCIISTAKVKKFHDLPYVVLISANCFRAGEAMRAGPNGKENETMHTYRQLESIFFEGSAKKFLLILDMHG